MFGSLSAVAVYGGILGLLILALSINVTRLRAKHKSLFGDADEDELRRAIRAQANAVEYIPVCILLLLIMSAMGYAAWLINLFGIILIVSRLLHVYGIVVQTGDLPMGRLVGMSGTWLILGLASLLALIGGLF
ncbi:MAG: MAPEG family protein [Pseudomonadota bacterium]